MRIDLSCPVESRGVTVKNNSKTGEPYALFRLFNLSDKTIQGLNYQVNAYDAFGKELGSIAVSLSDLDGKPKEFFAANKAISLKDYPEAKHFVPEFEEITFEDGSVYTPSDDIIDIDIAEPDYEEHIRLMSVAGNDAACYAKDPGTYWLCVCGRPNKESDDTCCRCGRDKDMVMSKFSSRDRVSQALEAKAIEAEAAAQEEARRLAEEKEQKKKKALKITGISAGCVAGAALLIVIGFFVYGFAVTKIADSKVAQGNYIEAYSMYRSVNSKNIGNASEKVRGNSLSNMLQYGLMTSDEENLYYINGNQNIIKENKTTHEKTQLGEAQAIYLNVAGDWVYYSNAADGALACVKTDGSETKTILQDTKLVFFSVVGDDLYYILQEEDPSAANTQQNAAAQQQQQQNTIFNLYNKKVDSDKATKISKSNMGIYTVYKDRIYYLNNEEQAIYSMKLDGSDLKMMISGPVYGFDVYNDTIYYLDGTTDESQVPKYSLETADLNGTHTGTVISDAKVASFAVTDDAIYFNTVDEATGSLKDSLMRKDLASGEVKTIIESDVNMYNVADDTVFYMNMMGEFFKVNSDGTGLESQGALAQ